MVDLREKERLYEFLMGFDNKFDVIRTQILAMNSVPKLENHSGISSFQNLQPRHKRKQYKLKKG